MGELILKKKNALVSVVVPVYKTEKYLDRCIESIVRQTYRNIEILLINDGSPDNCPQMCDEWAERDSRIRVIHKPNEGLGMARNTGLVAATSEYICFFDSDDYIDKDTIRKAVQSAESHQSDIVLFGMYSVDGQNRIIKENSPMTVKKVFYAGEIQTCLLPDLIDCHHKGAENKQIGLSACSCLFSMELLKRARFRFVSERSIISEDSYSLTMLYSEVKCVSVIQEALYYYCENNNSLTRTFREDRVAKIKDYYLQSLTLAERCNYCEEVKRSISGVFMSFLIGAMKQIVASSMKKTEKYKMLSEIVFDGLTQRAIRDISLRKYGRTREILFFSMKHKFVVLTYVLLMAQVAFQSK